MSFSNKNTGIVTGTSTIEVPATARKHQLAVEFFDNTGAVVESANSTLGNSIIQVSARMPDGTGHLDIPQLSFGMYNHIRNYEMVADEFKFTPASDFPGTYSYRVFWSALS